MVETTEERVARMRLGQWGARDVHWLMDAFEASMASERAVYSLYEKERTFATNARGELARLHQIVAARTPAEKGDDHGP